MIQTINRYGLLPYLIPHQYDECAFCEQKCRCLSHADYPGMNVCMDCLDERCPPCDEGDHSNHWEHANWDSLAKMLGRELVEHGTCQDNRYYPRGERAPANRPHSNHVGRQAFVQEQMKRLRF